VRVADGHEIDATEARGLYTYHTASQSFDDLAVYTRIVKQ